MILRRRLAIALPVLGALASLPGIASAAAETALLPSAGAPARLTLAHWPAEGWVVRQTGRVAEIRFAGAALDIDLSAVGFPALGGRLAGAQAVRGPEGTTLTLELGCDCRLALHGNGEDRLAIDIVDALAPAGPVLLASGPAPGAAPAPSVRRAHPDALAASSEPRRPGPETAAAGVAPDGAADGTVDIAAARDRLIAQLERAADAGLIELEGHEPARPDEPQARPRDSGARPADAARRSPHPAAGVGMRHTRKRPANPAGTPGPASAEDPVEREMRAETEDAAIAGLPGRAGTAEPEPSCSPETAFALPETPPGTDRAARAARLRKAVLGEFDTPDAEAVMALARNYIAEGLGAEAALAVSEFAADDRDAPLLAAMAHLIEGRALADGLALPPVDCGPAAALWHALAHAADGRNEDVVALAAPSLSALDTLPRALKSAIAARIGLALARAGALGPARDFQAQHDRARRRNDPPDPVAALLAAALYDELGASDAAWRARAEARALGGPVGLEATVELGETAVRAPRAEARDSHHLRLDLGIVARLARGTPLGRRALIAEAQLAARSDGRQAALDLLASEQAVGGISAEGHRLAVEAVGAIEGIDDTGPPLALIYEQAPERYASALAEPGFRRALARSYAEIGAPALGAALLRDVDRDDQATRLALARGHLRAGALSEAEALADGLTQDAPRRALLRDIHLARGEAAAALALLEADGGDAADKAGLTARLAWEAEDWPAAVAALEALQARAPTPDRALRLAHAREQAGLTAPPGSPRPLPEPNPAGVARFIAAQAAETSQIEEALDDG